MILHDPMDSDNFMSPASERNKLPILKTLAPFLTDVSTVLEVGSRWAQHALFFSENFPHLKWIPTDIPENFNDLKFCLGSHQIDNISSPEILDVSQKQHWEALQKRCQVDFLYTANTFHIMPLDCVEDFWSSSPMILLNSAKVTIYGPFFDSSKKTAPSNKEFDQSLKKQIPGAGIRNIEDILNMAHRNGFQLFKRFEMPANNELLVFEFNSLKSSS